MVCPYFFWDRSNLFFNIIPRFFWDFDTGDKRRIYWRSVSEIKAYGTIWKI